MYSYLIYTKLSTLPPPQRKEITHFYACSSTTVLQHLTKLCERITRGKAQNAFCTFVSKHGFYNTIIFGCFCNSSSSPLPAFLLCSPVCQRRTMAVSHEARGAISEEGQCRCVVIIVGGGKKVFFKLSLSKAHLTVVEY